MICQYVTTRNIKQENIPGWCRIGMTRIKDMLIGCIDKKYLGYDFSHIINELSEAELVTAVTTKQFGACNVIINYYVHYRYFNITIEIFTYVKNVSTYFYFLRHRKFSKTYGKACCNVRR